MASESNSRNLNDLRVSDLREELEKRGLDKSGVKSALVKRLQQALSEEGDNIESSKDNSIAEDCAQTGEQTMDGIKNEQINDMQDVDNSLDIDPDDVDPNDLVIKDELDASIGEENCTKDTEEADVKEPIKENQTPLKKLEVKVENCLPKQRPGPASSKLNPSAVYKQVLDTSHSENKPAENQTEQDDSINLTIGEDEEKLLQEADDPHHRTKGTDVKQQSKSQTGNLVQESSIVSKVEPVDEEQTTEVTGHEESEETSTATSGEKKKDDKTDSKTQQADGTSSSTTSKSGGKDDKDSAKKSTLSINASRNLWVSGLSGSTRATDLKQVFSKYGKVIGAKVVTNARTPGAKCYGYVTMATNEEAVHCMHNLHRTELHGRVVSVERAKSDGTVPAKKDSVKSENVQDAKSDIADKQINKTLENEASRSVKSGEVPTAEEGNEQTDKPADSENETKPSDTKSVSKDKERSSSRKSRSKHNSKSKDRERSPRNRRGYKSDTSRERKMQVLSFQQIRAEREKQRMRDRERALREEERRRREEQQRNREVERWQREEAQRLAKEREKLQREREKIERERVEILKLERTRQKLERERLEFERMELKRQQMKIEEARMAAKRSALDRREPYPPHDERKRPAMNERRLEAPPPPRFDQVTSSVGAGPGGSNRPGGYNDPPDVLSSKKRDYNNKRDEMRKNESRGNEFKRGGDFDILPRHSGAGGAGHMMHPSHASSHQGSIIKYPVQSYEERGRDNSDIGGSRQDSTSAGPMQSSRSKDSGRYAERSSDRPSERGSGLSYRGSERDNGRRPVEAPDHRSSSGNNKIPPRGGSRERRYVDTNIKDSGRYNDRPNSSWHPPGGSSSTKPYGGLNSNIGSMNSGQNIASNNPWANDTRTKPSQNQSAWRQVDSASNDRWARTPLYPPGVPPSQAITGSSSSYIDHRYNMSSMRKY